MFSNIDDNHKDKIIELIEELLEFYNDDDWIILKKWECNKCHSSGTMRNERLLPKVCCKQEVSWLK